MTRESGSLACALYERCVCCVWGGDVPRGAAGALLRWRAAALAAGAAALSARVASGLSHVGALTDGVWLRGVSVWGVRTASGVVSLG